MDLRHKLSYSVSYKDRSSQTNLFSHSVTMYTFVRDELTQSFTIDLRHIRTFSVFHKGPSSQTNLFSLSQMTFVTDELTQSLTKDLD